MCAYGRLDVKISSRHRHLVGTYYRGAAAGHIHDARLHYLSLYWPAPSRHQTYLCFHGHVAHGKIHALHQTILSISLPHIHTTHLLSKTIPSHNTAFTDAMERSTSMTSAQQVLRDALACDFSRIERKGEIPERRPSTVVNEDGCIVQRGFLVPNRTSPSHPRTARPPPATYWPIQGFPRPTGSLFDAPELRVLARKHPESLHRPTKSAGDLEHMANPNSKPSMGERRQTWQSGAPSTRWTDEELAGVTCKPSSTYHAHTHAPGLATGRRDRIVHMHRTPNVQGDLHALEHDQSRKDSTTRQSKSHEKKKNEAATKQDIRLVSQADAEDAIASDSEDDDNVLADAEHQQRLAAQRKRTSYAERREIQDEKAAQEYNRGVAKYDARSEQQVPQRVRLTTTDQHESAIESDSEDEDEQVTTALRTATIHRYHNQIATSQGAAGFQIKDEITQSPRKGSDHRASLTVKITSEPVATLAIPGKNAKGGVTPREVKSFEVDAPQKCHNLRPSKSRPRPTKGVLKKTDSTSSSSSSSNESPTKHVKTVKRQTFTSRCIDALTPSFTAIQSYWQTPRTQQRQQYQHTDPTGQAE